MADDAVHTMPVNDLIDHDETEDCLCGPEIVPVPCEDGFAWQVIHHALDDRD